MIHGKKLILLIDGTPVAAAKSCNLDLNQSLIAVASPTDGKWSKSVQGTCSWAVSCDCLMATADSANLLLEKVANGDSVTALIQDTTDNIALTGTALIESATITAAVGSLSQFSIKLTGSGALSGFTHGIEIDDEVFDCRRFKLDGEVVEDDDAAIYYAEFVLSHATTVKITIPDGTIVARGKSTLNQAIYNEDDITEHVEEFYDESTTVVWPAGNYYIAISELDSETARTRLFAYS